MEAGKKKLARDSAFYAFFTLLQRGFSFFLLPIYTSILSADQYGILSISLAVIPFTVLILGLSLRGSTAYYYFQYIDDDPIYLKRLLGCNFVFILIVSCIGSLLIFFLKDIVVSWILKDIPFYPYILLALISIALQPTYLFYQSLLKAKREAKKSASIDFFYFLTITLLTLLFIIVLDLQAEGALLALSISNFIVFIISVYNLTKETLPCLDKELLKKTLHYSLPILPHNLSGWAMNLADRIILNSYKPLNVVGVFDVGSQLGKVVSIITLGVNSAYSPWFFENIRSKNENSKQTIAEVTERLNEFYVLIAIGISWLSPEILKIIGKDIYHHAWIIVPFISFAFVINGFYYSFSNVFFLDKTKYLPYLSFAGAAINIILNLILIPRYSIIGAAIANLSAKLLFTGLTFFVSQKICFIPYNLKRIAFFIFLGFLGALSLFLFQESFEDFHLAIIILIKTTLMVLIIAFFLFYNIKILRKLKKK